VRSGEVARLAGVTVRALRHYHQVGVLAEPDRDSNGYRSYDVHDLIRVLRIKRLASVGIALERMPDLLDDEAVAGSELLDELDAELQRQIERLSEHRAVIARLRAHDALPDLPPELAPSLAVFAAAGVPAGLARIDREQSVLLAQLVGSDGMPQLVRIYERLAAPEIASAAATLAARFDALGEDSTEDDAAAVATDFAAVFAPLLDELAGDTETVDLSGGARLLSQYMADVTNPRQQQAMEMLMALLPD